MALNIKGLPSVWAGCGPLFLVTARLVEMISREAFGRGIVTCDTEVCDLEGEILILWGRNALYSMHK